MRYRPFAEGVSTSAVALSLPAGRTEADAFALVCAALECGINTFSLAAGDPAGAEALRRACRSVGRRLLVLLLRLDPAVPDLVGQARAALEASGAGAFDAAVLDRPAPGALTPAVTGELQAIRGERLAARLALACEPLAALDHLDALPFDLLCVRYNIASGWAERNVLKAAAARGLTLLGYGAHVEGGAAPSLARGLARLFRRDHGAAADPYRFLRETPDWTAEQITLAFALTEPGLASILVEPPTPKALEALAAIVERQLPTGVAAQIEMARFAAAGRDAA